MANTTPPRPEGDSQTPAQPETGMDPVADPQPEAPEPTVGTVLNQTDEEQEITSFMGVIQTEMQRQGWSFDVVATGDPTILGATSPNGVDYSVTMNQTP